MEKHDIADQLDTIRDFLRYGISRFNEAGLFYGHGTDNAWDEALSIVLHTLYLPMDSDKEVLDAKLVYDEKIEILSIYEKRIEERVPVPYLLNQAWFYGLAFYVDERVLIPRSPVAEIIEAHFRPWYQGEYPDRILDLCCGSGCIGIACAYEFPQSEVTLSDISEDALDVANINIEKHDREGQVFTVQSDLFEDIHGLYDVIITNPPYVDEEDMANVPPEYQHEPRMALESGELGLDHPLQILRQAANYLTDDGILILEVGNSGQHLEDLYPGVEFNWVAFERGGHGVLVISKEELLYYQDQLSLDPELFPDESDFYED